MAHELGHQVNKDIPLGIAFQTVLTLVGLYLVGLGLNAGVARFRLHRTGRYRRLSRCFWLCLELTAW